MTGSFVLDGPTLLDGAMGTMLLRCGMPPGILPEEWLLRGEGDVSGQIHASHRDAGAEVLLTSTFNCAAPRLEAALGKDAIPAVCARAGALARWAARIPTASRRAAGEPRGAPALVAGAVGPTGLVAPGGAASRRALVARYEFPLRALADAGVDLLWLESQWDLGEARTALAVAQRTGLPVVVTFTFAEVGGRLRAPDGAAAEDCLRAIAGDGALAAGVNCVFAGPALAALAGWAAASLPVPFVAKPSPGLPGAVATPAAFAEALRPAFEAGLRIAGGCCGATADHLRALAPLVSR